MSLADLKRDGQYDTLGGIDATRSKRPSYKVTRRPDSKSLFREGKLAANREAVQPNMGRVQQDNILLFFSFIRAARQIRGAVRPTPPQLKRRELERFQGFVETVEGDLAYVSLATDRGERICGAYPVAELAAKGVGERDRFVLTTIELGDVVRFDIRPIPRRKVSPERQRAIREMIEHELGGYSPDDDY